MSERRMWMSEQHRERLKENTAMGRSGLAQILEDRFVELVGGRNLG